MGFAEILQRATQLTASRFAVLFGLCMTLFLPMSMLASFVQPTPGSAPPPDELAAYFGVLGIFGLIAPVLSCGLTHVLDAALEGRDAGLGDGFRVAGQKALPALWTTLLYGGLVLVGSVLLILPGIYLAYALGLAYQAVTLENRSGLDALQRSHELVRGSWWRVFGLMLLVGFGLGGLSTAVTLGLQRIPMLETLGQATVQSLTYAFTTAVLVLLHRDLRDRQARAELLTQLGPAPEPLG